jgi:hypothetical protein
LSTTAISDEAVVTTFLKDDEGDPPYGGSGETVSIFSSLLEPDMPGKAIVVD